MLDQKSDEPFVCAERRAMNADRDLLGVVAVFIPKIKIARLGEIDLVCCDGKLASDHAPDLDVDLWSVKRRFVGHFYVIDLGIFWHAAGHLFSLFPKLRFVHKFLAKP